MKKIFKRIFIILINLIIIILLTELICYLSCIFSLDEKYEGFFARIKKYGYKWNYYGNFDDTYEYIKTNKLRKPVGLKYKRKPILLMGCSFAYGYNLKENENLGYRLSELLKRPVYNRGGSGWGLDQYLYLSRRNDFYTKIPAPEYIIYIYMADHLNRISRFKLQPLCIEFKPKYKLKNDKLIEIKPKFYDRFFFVENYQFHYNYKKKVITENALIEKYFTEVQAEFKKHWPDAKLVILLYPICNDKGPLDNSFIWDDLRKKGFIVIDLTKLENYKLDFDTDEYSLDGFHPNSKIWDLILPKILKELGI